MYRMLEWGMKFSVDIDAGKNTIGAKSRELD